MAADLQEHIHDQLTPKQVIDQICSYLYKDKYYRSSQNGWDHSNLYLNLILEGRQGYCLGFVELWLAIGERIKWRGKPLPLYGVNVPQHVFIRWDDGSTRINVETLHIPVESKDPRKTLLDLLRRRNVPQVAGQNLSDNEYQNRYEISQKARDNKVYLQNCDPREVLALIYFNRSCLHRDELKKLKDISERKKVKNRIFRDLKMCIKLAPTNIDSLSLYGYSRLYYKKDYKLASKYFKKCLKMNPSEGNYMLMVLALIGAKRYKEALKYIDKAYEASGNSEASFAVPMMEAYIYYATKQYEKGIKFCNSYIEVHKSEDYLYHNMFLMISKMEFYRKQGHYDKAYSIGKFILDTEVKTYEEYVLGPMGIIHVYLGELKKADEFFEKALKIDPQNADALNGKGLLCIKEKRFEDAIKYFKTVLDYEAIHIDAETNLNNLQRLLNRKKSQK